ncbi:hypothetical protein BU25DRAFT_33646 [Macroventuria anomochaeta]|uniref:Uncharacterized protein n=1 Tax=Macroventuria anomochaeta TaxID=301207 RepID=A0ACB6S312_9PLEO|nr:uncharacterized protein BU25DRAFT_33646 [Macroventuria anomochaeta]KAF2628333.1 hypothetical protein BU25DRAFT_33646 [Macroventuria anomochaeta]
MAYSRYCHYGQSSQDIPSACTTLGKPDIPREVKTKSKTRGVPQVEEPKQIAETPEVSSLTVTAIQLSKSPYAALRCMFPSTLEEHQKSVDWTSSVNSMNRARFTARNGEETIARFENRNGEGSINFHRPHPDPTIDLVMLQAMGWRMNKWLDRVRETLVLAKKSEKAGA